MDQGRALLPQSKAQKILACACGISLQPVLSVPQSVGVIRLGFKSIPEAITTTFPFFRSDKLVYINTWLRPISPCQPTQAMAEPFLTCGIPIRPLQAEFTSFMDASNKSWGAQMRDSQISCQDPFRPQAHQHFGAQGSNFGPHHCFSFTRPPTYDRYRQNYSCSLYQQTGWD